MYQEVIFPILYTHPETRLLAVGTPGGPSDDHFKSLYEVHGGSLHWAATLSRPDLTIAQYNQLKKEFTSGNPAKIASEFFAF
jgi:hypothetical protein